MCKEEKIIEDGGWLSVAHFVKSGGDDGPFPFERGKVVREPSDADRVETPSWFRLNGLEY